MPEIKFEELAERHRHELLLHCYRLLGSLTDAEDALQETLLAAWKGLDRFEGRSLPRTWLYSIATNRCLNALRARRRRNYPPPTPPFRPPEPSRHGDLPWLQPYPDSLLEGVSDDAPGPEVRYTTREAVELAFITALQRLAPRQAAVLILCDVLGYTRTEVAPMLDVSPTAVKGLLQRARASLERHRDGGEKQSSPESAAERRLVRRFADALTTDDFVSLVALLVDDAWLAMPPAPHEYHGAEAVIEFLRIVAEWRRPSRMRLEPCRANGQPAFTCRLIGAAERDAGLFALTPAGERLQGFTWFIDDRLPPYFQPDRASAGDSASKSVRRA